MKVHCPNHNDKHPSAYEYDNGTYCFTCSAFVAAPKTTTSKPKAKKQPEDLEAKFKYIESLPVTNQRGINAHTDDSGFYILYPSRAYYKYRLTSPRPGIDRYLGPSGHSAPLFVLPGTNPRGALLLIEGELNALSAKEACPEIDIISPGAAGNFQKYSAELGEAIKAHSRIVLWVDSDIAGYTVVLETGALIRLLGKDVIYTLSEKREEKQDANWMLMNQGKEALRNKLLKGLS